MKHKDDEHGRLLRELSEFTGRFANNGMTPKGGG